MWEPSFSVMGIIKYTCQQGNSESEIMLVDQPSSLKVICLRGENILWGASGGIGHSTCFFNFRYG